ncbi:histidinol-phosphatase [Ideonella livida]|uniref:HAD family hydrolase n=1 Tax=Ideonella livida TaxID=2707176 RepID=A0A7C9TMH7_9BURK|nr:HAD family hydrolase [Ideonella livida]NDY91706.1 HAD family hydrolase [Ideonella livida]
MNLALFDLDGTLLPGDSDHAFGQFMVDIGWADGAAWRARNDEFYAHYMAGTLVLADYIEFATAVWRQRPLEQALAARERYMSEVILPMIQPQARALVARHQRAGDLVAIVTATNEFVTRPIADAFGVQTLLAVELERTENGLFSGSIRGVPTFQAGKIARVKAWLADQGRTLDDFGDVHFYSDSTNDLPLLEVVRTPVATNPSPALARIAAERGWQVLNLFDTP